MRGEVPEPVCRAGSSRCPSSTSCNRPMHDTDRARDSMNIEQYVAGVGRRTPVVLLTALLVVLVALGVRALLPSKYTAAATLEVSSPAALSNEGVSVDDLQYLDRLENTFAKIAVSPRLVDRVARRVGERPD